MARFRVPLRWCLTDDERHISRLTVSGTYDSSPGNRRGHPDTWAPAWSEVNVERVEDEGGPLPPAVVGVLCADDRFLEAVEEAVTSRQY